VAKPRRVFGVLLGGMLVPHALAYRPFISTDADVARAGEAEIEYGALGIRKDGGETTVVTTDVRLNVGLFESFELVVEGASARREGEGSSDLVDPAIFGKFLVRRGALQGESGPSVALEAGVLLPETIAGSRRAGLEALAIVSERLGPFVAHVNAGVAVDRQAHRAQGIWGLIVERPLTNRIRIASEIAGESQTPGGPNHTALLGGIVELEGFPIAFDAGVREGLSKASEDWSFTIGFTVGFPLWSRPGA
jgi:hypothetical protein